MHRRALIALVAGCVMAGLAAGGILAVAIPRLHARPAAATVQPRLPGWATNRVPPPIPLVDESGRATSLADFRGRVVVLAPSLTLCGEVCPMTTGALIQIQHAVDAAGLGTKVAVAEVTVDPWRDSPARLRAYAKLTGVDFHLLTGSVDDIARFWKFFQIGYRKVPQKTPPDLDWWTNRPLTFDVEHSDAIFLIDARGHERRFMVGMPDLGGRLSPSLKALLSPSGLQNLKTPTAGWTVAQALQDLGALLGRPVPPAPG
ncbi:MAG: SCO family protein [Candidatus Dormibacteraceae bacterium]